MEDPLGTVKEYKTKKVSCQYPILEVLDLSADHNQNMDNNSWSVLTPFPTRDELIADPEIEKVYRASVWARENEQLYFHAKFPEGSHMKIDWTLTVTHGPADTPCVTVTNTPTPAPTMPSGVTLVNTADNACIFPFRYADILYYGCTKLDDGAGGAWVMCATATDSDYNANSMGWCNDFCHVQCKFI